MATPSGSTPQQPSNGRHAIVTGGGSGVGAEIALSLAAAGYRVTITGRRAAPLQTVAAKHPGITPLTCDVSDGDAARQFMDAATKVNGPPSIVVANAGSADSLPLAAMTSGDLRAMLDANLMTTFNVWHAALLPMREEKWGRMIAIASTAGLKGYPYVAGYVAAKHAVIGLTRAMALELAKTGITVNAICPGFTDTPMLERSLTTIMAKTGRSRDDALKSLVASNPQGRLISPSEIASLVLWLCSDAAASVTGQAIAVSGGET